MQMTAELVHRLNEPSLDEIVYRVKQYLTDHHNRQVNVPQLVIGSTTYHLLAAQKTATGDINVTIKSKTQTIRFKIE